ncbi:phosphopantetheine-binding protein, partial [Rhizobium leguminosarum]|uniref:phosphopantetheine-binding protein n=1 Tax=Rhizobium leguminosarum TaxID=384 RepID=UPI001C909651
MTVSVADSAKIFQISEWILAQNPGLERVDPDQNLFDSGLVSSLKFMEMILALEKIIDRS